MHSKFHSKLPHEIREQDIILVTNFSEVGIRWSIHFGPNLRSSAHEYGYGILPGLRVMGEMVRVSISEIRLTSFTVRLKPS